MPYLAGEVSTRDGAVYKQRLKMAENQLPPQKIGTAPRLIWNQSDAMPGRYDFSTTDLEYNTIAERLKESAFLLKNVHLSLTDRRTGVEFH